MIPIALAASLAVSTFTGHHADELCEKIRAVRSVAQQQRLDDRTLAQLEGQYCAPAVPPPPPGGPQQPPPPPGQGQWQPQQPQQPQQPPVQQSNRDCADLSMMLRLAQMSDAKGDVMRTIEAQRSASCVMGDSQGRFSWPNGVTAKNGYGTWSYPNGVTAKNSYGSWSYFNGVTAKNSYGAWSYPNGVTAKNSSGQWFSPQGYSATPQSLIAQVCSQGWGRDRDHGGRGWGRGGRDRCSYRVEELRGLSGDSFDLALIELVYDSAR